MCVLFVNFAQRFRLQNVTVLTMCLRSAAAALRAAARAVMGAVFRHFPGGALFAAGRAVVITIFSQNIQLLNIY